MQQQEKKGLKSINIRSTTVLIPPLTTEVKAELEIKVENIGFLDTKGFGHESTRAHMEESAGAGRP